MQTGQLLHEVLRELRNLQINQEFTRKKVKNIFPDVNVYQAAVDKYELTFNELYADVIRYRKTLSLYK